jgi:hypothetical protein
MPALAVIHTGLTAPDFGDTGVDTNGVPLPDDQGIDLELGRYHYYAAIVPTNNSGLLHVQLHAISGNPDFYLRVAQVPTSSHTSNGIAGTMFERSLTSGTTEYGNFVPLNGRVETKLQPGTWYFRRARSGQRERALPAEVFDGRHSGPRSERGRDEQPKRGGHRLALLSRADSGRSAGQLARHIQSGSRRRGHARSRHCPARQWRQHERDRIQGLDF